MSDVIDLETYKDFVSRMADTFDGEVATIDPATGSFSTETAAVKALLGAVGLSGEAGEVLELHKKWLLHGKPLSREKLLLELGDVLWYLTLLSRIHGITFAEIIHANIAKLEARYGKR
jgi:NTP pyrophosphatase (non-canonical NTP hydrolase)